MAEDMAKIAIVSDIALIEAAALLEEGVVTPSTLFATNSLVQAVVLHDKIVLGMAGLVGAGHPSIDAINVALGRDISTIPTVGGFHARLSQDVYAKILHWVASERPIANMSATSEVSHFSAVLDYLRARQLADITDEAALAEKFGVTKPFGSSDALVSNQELYSVFSQDVIAKGGTPLSANDLFALRDLAWTAASGYTLSRFLRINVYHSLIERPFYGSQLKRPKGPLDLVRKATEELEVEEASFNDIDIPPFLGLILSSNTFQKSAFWGILLDTRERHHAFRKSITEFQQGWNQAKTVGEQRILLKEQERAWAALLEREEYLAKERITYILGRAATTLGKSLMNDAIKYDEFDQAIHTVGGLVRLWSDLQDIVPSKDGRTILSRHFRKLPPPEHWGKVLALTAGVNSAAGLAEPSV